MIINLDFLTKGMIRLGFIGGNRNGMDLLGISQRTHNQGSTHNRITVFYYEKFDIVWFLAQNLGIEPLRDVFSVWDWIMLSVLSRIWDNDKRQSKITNWHLSEGSPNAKNLKKTKSDFILPSPLLTTFDNFWRFLSTLSINWIAMGVW